MSVPRYVTRIARLPRVFEHLQRHADGVPLRDLADAFGVPVEELREDLLAFYSADVDSDWLLGLGRPEVVEFLGADGTSEDPGTAQVVRLVTESPADLGVEYVDAGELGLVYAAALALQEIEPGNSDLAGALDVLTETMLGEPVSVPGVRDAHRLLPLLQEAQRARRTVRLVYSRAWDHGVTEREVEPYRLVQTRRGWELDAGPVDAPGQVRTYLLSHVRSAEVLVRTFTMPPVLAERLAEQRATTLVRVLLPQEARWAADFYAEQVTLVEDDEESVVVDLALLPPVERRVGMLLLAAGPAAFVVTPPALHDAGARLAAELLEHHRSR